MADTIAITSRLSVGESGLDDDIGNPFARALAKLLSEGDPIPRLAACYLNQAEPGKPEQLRWIGMLMYSYGGRLILFPGFSQKYESIYQSRGSGQPQLLKFETDHISLERDLKSSHVTTAGSGKHVSVGPSHPIGAQRFVWCGMSVATPETLRKVLRETTVRATIPETDSRRRARVIEDARSGIKDVSLQLHPAARQQFEPGFLHFTFVVGPVGFPTARQNLDYRLPYGSGHVVGSSPGQGTSVPMRVHRVSLAPALDVEITAVWLPGRLSVPILFTS